jgi:hypothetical protein
MPVLYECFSLKILLHCQLKGGRGRKKEERKQKKTEEEKNETQVCILAQH